MNKKLSLLVSIMLAACFLFIPLLSSAASESWTCANCGTVNTGNFCTQCGQPPAAVCPNCNRSLADCPDAKFCPQCGAALGSTSAATTAPASDRTFEITDVTLSDNGSVRLQWTDSAKLGPYTVSYEFDTGEDYTSDQQLLQLRWTAAESLSGTSCTISALAPGVPYYLLVTDSAGSTATTVYYRYRPSTPLKYPDFGIAISMDLKCRNGEKVTNLKSYSAVDLEDVLSGKNYGAYIKLTYPQLKKARTYYAVVAVTDPNGSVIVDMTSDSFELPSGRSYSYWQFYSMDWYFLKVIQQYGYVPSGAYTWTLYVNGMLANNATFNVTQ